MLKLFRPALQTSVSFWFPQSRIQYLNRGQKRCRLRFDCKRSNGRTARSPEPDASAILPRMQRASDACETTLSQKYGMWSAIRTRCFPVVPPTREIVRPLLVYVGTGVEERTHMTFKNKCFLNKMMNLASSSELQENAYDTRHGWPAWWLVAPAPTLRIALGIEPNHLEYGVSTACKGFRGEDL